jgi:ribose 5-phosphate isomerase A
LLWRKHLLKGRHPGPFNDPESDLMKWTSTVANELRWSGAIINQEAKKEVANRLSQKVRDKDVIGVGSGSTVFLTIQAIGERIATEGIKCTAIPTSVEGSLACAAMGIPTTNLLCARPDWAFDGADEVDPNQNLIKGRGGALFREKLLMRVSPKNFIVVDRSKLVSKLGQSFPVPIEVYPDAVHYVENALLKLEAAELNLRLAVRKDGPVITESGNFILDVRFAHYSDDLEQEIKRITGVIESGLFIGYPIEVLVSDS